MANHRKAETASRLKKFYSTMSNAIKLAELEEGRQTYEMDELLGRGEDAVEAFNSTGILKHLSISKIDYLTADNNYFKDLELYGDEEQFVLNKPIFYLNDGSLVCVDDYPSWIVYDVNGEKGPNKSGRDIFDFHILIDNDFGSTGMEDKVGHFNTYLGGDQILSIVAFKSVYKTRSDIIEQCKNGGACAYLIQSDGWEIKDDYPFRL